MDLEAVREFRLKPIEQAYNFRDSILYALGLGYGGAPYTPSDLQFVYEKAQKALPSSCVVLAHPGFWVNEPALKLDWVKILHGEQSFQIHQPLKPEGCVRGEYEITAVKDKGIEKGAVLYQAKRLYDVETNALLATVNSVLVMRGDGGHGGFGSAPPPPTPITNGKPDFVVDIPTLSQSALLYRLSGDYNPIHADPVAARRGGLSGPILHGLCTMGVATRALISTVAGGDPDRIKSLAVRFSSPVFPGETIRTEIFGTGLEVRFRSRVLERDVVVLDRATAVIDEKLKPANLAN